MSIYDDRLSSYEEEAEDRYDDYYPQEAEYEEDFEEEYIPALGDYDNNYNDGYMNQTVGRIDPNDRTLTVVVKNSSDNDAEAIVFAANESPDQPAGVTVTVEESSHREVQEESKSNPFTIQGMKMSVSDELQFDNVLKITRRTATGSTTTRVYQPRNSVSPQNFTAKLIDDNRYEMDVTGSDSLRFTIRAKATAVFTFTIKARTNMGNILRGNHVAELSRAPRTTGLPQIDLLRENQEKKELMPPSELDQDRTKRRAKYVMRKRENR